MAAVVSSPPPAPPLQTKPLPVLQGCPTCGTSVPAEMMNVEGSLKRILELEAQIDLLKEKATTAVDKCADYEDQIRTLTQAKIKDKLLRSNTSDLGPARGSEDPPRPSTAGAATTTTTSRFSFFTSRRASPPPRVTQLPPPSPTKDRNIPADLPIDIALFNELERERALRTEAEARANKVDSEIEELSVQLFSQANEMVAEERRARAKLEERVETLERRDREKMGRLERLEKAVNRIERVKALLKDTNRPEAEVMVSDKTLLSPPGR